MEEIKWNEFKKTYKNNLLILNLFSFHPFFLSILFPSHFPSKFPRTKHSLGSRKIEGKKNRKKGKIKKNKK